MGSPYQPNMESVSVRFPASHVRRVEQLVERGKYPNKSEAIRAALLELLEDVDAPIASDGGLSRIRPDRQLSLGVSPADASKLEELVGETVVVEAVDDSVLPGLYDVTVSLVSGEVDG